MEGSPQGVRVSVSVCLSAVPPCLVPFWRDITLRAYKTHSPGARLNSWLVHNATVSRQGKSAVLIQECSESVKMDTLGGPCSSRKLRYDWVCLSVCVPSARDNKKVENENMREWAYCSSTPQVSVSLCKNSWLINTLTCKFKGIISRITQTDKSCTVYTQSVVLS